MWYVVRSGSVRGGTGENLFTQTGVSSTISIQRCRYRCQPALTGGTRANTDDCCVAFGMKKQALLTRIKHLDRTICHLAEQGHVYLSGNVFLTAKPAAHQGCNNTHLVRFPSQGSGRLVPVQVGNLAAYVDR